MSNNGLGLSALAVGFLALILGLSAMIYPIGDEAKGNIQPEYYEGHYYISPICNYPSGMIMTFWSGSLTAHYFPVLSKIRIDRIGVGINNAGQAGETMRLGFYKSDGKCYPQNLIVDSGQLLIDTIGMKVATINVTLDAGLYFIAWITDTDTAKGWYMPPIFSGLGMETGFLPYGSLAYDMEYGGLPETFPSPPSWFDPNIFSMGFRVAENL